MCTVIGCVKQHPDRVDATNEIYAIPQLNPSPQGVRTDDGDKVESLTKATYFVQDDYLGCESSDAQVGSLAENDKLVVTLSTGESAACVKPSSVSRMKVRPDVTFFKAPQGQAYKIQTRGVLRASGRTQSPSGVTTEGEVGIKILNIVDYTTDSPLLNQIKDRIDLRAEPYKVYEVYHKITPTHIFIMKVGPKEELSHLDLPIADNMGDGRFAVPIAAAPLTLHNYRAIRNGDGQKTNVYEFYQLDELKTATHVKFNVSAFKEIDLPDTIAKDLYPADYFLNSLWYVSESVVETRPGSEGFIGTTTGSFDMDLRQASKVQFTRTSSSLVACNVGEDKRFENDPDCSNSSTVLTLPATGHAYTLTAKSDSIEEERVLGYEAPFLKLDFERNSSTRKSIDKLNSVFSVLSERQDQLYEVSFSENKFSFVVERGDTGLRVRYSFLRADNRPAYQPKRHFKDDRQKRFGYFVETIARIGGQQDPTPLVPNPPPPNPEDYNQEEDLEKDYLVQRHNPNQDIYFYFSNLTPDYTKTPDPYGTNIDYREIGRKAVDYWNRAFERAGAPNKIVLVEEINGQPFDAPFGDISYNTINLIDSVTGSNLLGVGPSLTDPYTGEIINTNANVYIAPFREIVAGRVRSFIRSKLGYYEGPANNLTPENKKNSTLIGDYQESLSGGKDFFSQLFGEDSKSVLTMVANFYHRGVQAFNLTPSVSTTTFSKNGNEIGNLYKLRGFNDQNAKVKFLKEMAPRVPELNFLAELGKITLSPQNRSELLELEEAFQKHRPSFYRSYMMSENLSGFNEFNSLSRQIAKECSEVSALISRVKARTPEGVTPTVTTDEERPALKHCMQKIIPEKFMATLVHEMGHNLGLRHNFFGSTDKKNFYNQNEVKEIFGLDINEEDLPKSSTVMEYVRTEQDRLFFPGHYDIAAIRYGYADSVELASSATRPNSPEGDYYSLKNTTETGGGILNEVKSHTGKDIVDFKYCTDVQAIMQIDPMCDRHDFGTNPQMVVDDVINSYWESFVLYNFKYDSIAPGVMGPFARSSRTGKLKRFYDEWRVALRNRLGLEDSTGNAYLQRYTVEEYTKLIKALKNDSSFLGSEYLAVRDQIFDFFMEVAFFPNHYCFVGTPVGPKALEFSSLKEEARNLMPPKGSVAKNCENEYIQKVIEQKEYSYFFEAGLPVDNMWYEINPIDTFEEGVNFAQNRANLDVVGTFLDRFMASGALASRQSGFVGLFQKMFPSMLDEPDLYQRFEEKLLSRVTNGVDLTKAVETAKVFDVPEGQALVLPNYESESALIKSMWLSLEQSVRNPFADTSSKQSRFTRLFTDDLNQIQDVVTRGGVAIPLTNGETLVVPPSAEVTLALAEKFTQLNQQFRAASIEVPSVESLTAVVNQVSDVGAQILAQGEDQMEESGPTRQTASQNNQAQVQAYLTFSRFLMSVLPQLGSFESSLIVELFQEELLIYLVELEEIDSRIMEVQNSNLVPHPEDLRAREQIINRWIQRGLASVAPEVQQQINPELGLSVKLPSSAAVLSKKEEALSTAQALVSQAQEVKTQEMNFLDVHGDELFAQRDLLRAILTFDFNEIDETVSLTIVELIGDTSIFDRPDAEYMRGKLSDKAVVNDIYKIPTEFKLSSFK